MAPKTTAGRLVTILYALVGIPLTFLYLSNMGNFMAECFRLFYKKICCRICIFCMKSDGRKDPEDAAGEEEEAAAAAEEEEDRERMEMAARRNFAFLSVEEEEEEDDDEEEETARGGGRGRGVAIRCPDGSKEEFALRDVEKTGASSPNEKSRSGRRRQADCSGESEGAQVAATAAGRRPRSSGLADETETAVNHFSEVEIHVPDVSSSAPVDDSGDPAPENRITEAQSIPRRPSPLCPRERGASNRLSNGGNNPLRRASGSDAPGFGPKTEGDGQEYIPLRRLQKRTLESAKPAGNGPDQTSKVGASVEMESDGGKVSPPSAADEGASNGQGDDRQQRLMYGQMMATKRRLRAAAAGSSDDDLMTDDEGEVTVPISICLLIIGVYIFSGSLLFTVWEDWDYLTGSYFCFVTLSTIGFGDIVPGTDMKEWAAHQKLVLCSLWLVVGLSLLAMCFNLMQEEVKDWCRSIGHKLGILKD